MGTNFRLITLRESFGDEFKTAVRSSHILLYTKDDSREEEVIYGLMQMKSEGIIGFPGGKLRPDIDHNDIVKGLYRELKEEINFIPSKDQITLSDHICTHVFGGRIKHFFVKELPLTTFESIERNHMKAEDFPKESVGLFRIPLRATDLVRYNGFRHFFTGFGANAFSGMTRYQLIHSVVAKDLIGEEDVNFLYKVFNK